MKVQEINVRYLIAHGTWAVDDDPQWSALGLPDGGSFHFCA
jgi:hypothetical protein